MTDTQTATPKREVSARLALLCQQAAEERQKRIDAKNAQKVADLMMAASRDFAPLLLDELQPSYRWVKAYNGADAYMLFNVGENTFALEYTPGRSWTETDDEGDEQQYSDPDRYCFGRMEIRRGWRSDDQQSLYFNSMTYSNYGREEGQSLDEWLLLQIAAVLDLAKPAGQPVEDVVF